MLVCLNPYCFQLLSIIVMERLDNEVVFKPGVTIRLLSRALLSLGGAKIQQVYHKRSQVLSSHTWIKVFILYGWRWEAFQLHLPKHKKSLGWTKLWSLPYYENASIRRLCRFRDWWVETALKTKISQTPLHFR